MTIFRDLLRRTNDFLGVLDEAARLEAEYYKAKGWSKKNGTWVSPQGGTSNLFDGPGSPVSLRVFLGPAADNLGIDISEWGDTVDQVKLWLKKTRLQ
jgi:hypothetical protein